MVNHHGQLQLYTSDVSHYKVNFILDPQFFSFALGGKFVGGRIY